MFFSLSEAFDREQAIRLNFDGQPEAAISLSPVHLQVRQSDGAHQFNWTRRGRIDADRWDQEEIPLGEITERYRVIIKNEGGTELVNEMSSQSRFNISDVALSTMGVLPNEWLTLSIGQIGTSLDQVRSASTRFQFSSQFV